MATGGIYHVFLFAAPFRLFAGADTAYFCILYPNCAGRISVLEQISVTLECDRMYRCMPNIPLRLYK